MPSFVFKTSKDKAKMAMNMNKDGEHFLSNEFCFFDGKFKRCRGFVMLTASIDNQRNGLEMQAKTNATSMIRFISNPVTSL